MLVENARLEPAVLEVEHGAEVHQRAEVGRVARQYAFVRAARAVEPAEFLEHARARKQQIDRFGVGFERGFQLRQRRFGHVAGARDPDSEGRGFRRHAASAPPGRSAAGAAPVDVDRGLGVLRAWLRTDRHRSGADRFDRDAAAAEHRYEPQPIFAVDDDLEARFFGLDAARVMRDGAQIRAAAGLFATVTPRPPFVGQRGPETDRSGRRDTAPFRSTAVRRNHGSVAIRPGKPVS